MPSLHLISLHSNLPLPSSPPRLSLSKTPSAFTHRLIFPLSSSSSFPSSFSSSCVVRALDQESQFEVDSDKAREALQQLDQQLQSLSQKQVDPPKITASEVTRDEMIEGEEVPELPGSFLANAAIALIAFTIFYNVLFYAVIKPSIDGPGTGPVAPVGRQSPEEPLQRLQPAT